MPETRLWIDALVQMEGKIGNFVYGAVDNRWNIDYDINVKEKAGFVEPSCGAEQWTQFFIRIKKERREYPQRSGNSRR